MNEKSLKALEYNYIIERLSSFAVSRTAKERALNLRPSIEIHEIEDGLEKTSEAYYLIFKKGNLPIGDLYDIDEHLVRAKKGGILNPKELLRVLYNLKIAREVYSYLKGDLEDCPLIRELRDLIVALPNIEREIDRVIISEEEIADDASPKLKEIRREIRKANDQIKTKLNSLLLSEKTYLQDSIITLRDGRYVVPVKAENRSQIKGVIHDQSQTGQTLFIEPQAVVELNNKLRELEVDEQAEIERILLSLSGLVSEHFRDIKNNQDILTDLDFIFAKAKFSYDVEGVSPKINSLGIVELKKARHPLIDKKKVKPIDILVGENYKTLIITGPNTGGKTVALKTLGLFSMMAQSGLHIPANEGSTVPIFNEIFCDIGDEQSIEQSLSTFSSHMKNIVSFVDLADSDTLILLDELGAGTDPTEGAALGVSILEYLKAKGATILATTHYNEIKKYALSTDGVMNASMQFNVETLSPTYKLVIGIPGKSNAFEISSKLGLNNEIINRANFLIENDDLEFEDVITKINEDKKIAEEEKIETNRILAETKEKLEEVKRREAEIRNKENEIIASAKEKARDILSDVKDLTLEVQKELKVLNKVESLGERNKRLLDVKSKITEANKSYQTGIISEVNDNPVSIDDVKVGDRVKVLSIDQNGVIDTLPDKDDFVQVTVGQLKMKVKVDDLMYIGDTVSEKKLEKKHKTNIGKQKAMTVSLSHNVIGKNLEDALYSVEKYLDDAYISGLNEVTIIHGRGEGILQKGIRQMLKSNKMIASYHKGGYDEGGDGVTVCKFKR